MSKNSLQGGEPVGSCFQDYYRSLYKDLHEWRDYEKVSAGFTEWYYDCLPADREAKILDIGCGDGKFLFFLKKNGYANAEGLELSACLADLTHKRAGCRVHLVDDTVEFLKRNPGRYDTVTMNDVLEHIPKSNAVSLLSAVRESLVPGGNLVVNVPQATGFTSLYCRYNDFTHETIFTVMSLRQVLLLAGFGDIRFIKEKWPLKLTPRHLAYRLARGLWVSVLRLVYFIEQPGEIHPQSFQVRIVASASP